LYDGKFYPMTADVATTKPMLEMSGGRFKFIPEVLYIYNTSGINNDKVNGNLQSNLDKEIRSKEKYQALSCLFS